ncbi:hypothetical protein EG850_07470 [Gulosibacter macacae]|uniref:Rhodanese domain-containing protein n=1 Tax=Gulosibacter macacae TaxID=2488791 RepID=A0A3P3VVM7_9MICO|nr:HesA/MoeB/ThiF family protein [Gulosibacter macacae]RRJ86851.1 hypothetical protein EG850_07470 [Gulosibacter macacae]
MPVDDSAVPGAQLRHARLLGYGAPAVARATGARIAVVGAGGLGCPALRVLASAGVGELTIIDDDVVERSNLARQTLYTEADIGTPKVDAAIGALRAAAAGVDLVGKSMRIDAATAVDALAHADLVLDTTDDWPTRYAIADACSELGVPLVWGSVLAWDGMLTTLLPGGAVLDDLAERSAQLAAPARDCASAGVFAPLCAEIGAAMAGEALRLAAGLDAVMAGRVRIWDARRGTVRDLPLSPADSPAPGRSSDTPAPRGSSDAPSPGWSSDAVRPSNGSRRRIETTTSIPRTTLADLAPGTLILDVRPAAQPALDVDNAIDYQRASLEHLAAANADGTLDELIPLDRPLVVACALGPRARHAAELLRAAGADARVLDGGIPALAPHITTQEPSR